MTPESADLLLRKQRVQLRIERQRHDLRALLAEVESAAGGVDKARSTVDAWAQGLRRHKVAAGLVGAVLLVWRPVGILRWARRAWMAYEAASHVRRSGRSLLAAFQRHTVRRRAAPRV